MNNPLPDLNFPKSKFKKKTFLDESDVNDTD
jgi:hypothetical protein